MTPNKSNTTKEKDVTLMDNIENVDNIKKKRSLRKSVAFDGKNLQTHYICDYNYTFRYIHLYSYFVITETCVACAENKPVLPMTPYVRRSKTPSRRSKHALQDNDLISWNTPDEKQRKLKQCLKNVSAIYVIIIKKVLLKIYLF
jgi:hypothetical protein